MRSSHTGREDPASQSGSTRATEADSRFGFYRAAIAAAATALVCLPVYLLTLAPTVLGNDSGELVTTAHFLGNPHPTGYPIYMLLGKLFDLLPFSSPPVRIGLLSALCSTGAAAAIAWSAAFITRSTPAGLLAGLVAAFNGPAWSQASQVEVYALNALIIALAILVFVRGSKSRGARTVIWLALLAGVGLAHHRTAIFFTGPLLIAAAIGVRPRLPMLLKAAALAVAPLLFYLYLPLRACARPPVMWSDLSKWDNFVSYMLGAGYRHYVFARPGTEMLEVAREFVNTLSSELTPGGLALALVGVAALIRRDLRLSVSLLFSVVLLTVWNLGYLVEDWSVFFIPCLLAAGLWAGVGLSALASALRSAVGRSGRWAATALTVVVLLFVPGSLLQHNWSESGHRGHWKHYDLARAIFAQIPSNGIYITSRDPDFFVPMYLQLIEGVRPDVTVISTYGTYNGELQDPVLASAIPAMTSRFWRLDPNMSEEVRTQETLSFAVSVAELLSWSRPVYCGVNAAAPPFGFPVLSLWSDLFRVTQKQPDLLTRIDDHPALAEYEGGISLADISMEPDQVRPGQPFAIELFWRCARRVESPPFALVSLACEDELGRSRQPEGMLLRYGTWLAHGLCPLPCTSTGFAYRQRVVGIAPTNAPAGRWEVRVGLGSGPDQTYRVQPVAEFKVLPAAESGSST